MYVNRISFNNCFFFDNEGSWIYDRNRKQIFIRCLQIRIIVFISVYSKGNILKVFSWKFKWCNDKCKPSRSDNKNLLSLRSTKQAIICNCHSVLETTCLILRAFEYHLRTKCIYNYVCRFLKLQMIQYPILLKMETFSYNPFQPCPNYSNNLNLNAKHSHTFQLTCSFILKIDRGQMTRFA